MLSSPFGANTGSFSSLLHPFAVVTQRHGDLHVRQPKLLDLPLAVLLASHVLDLPLIHLVGLERHGARGGVSVNLAGAVGDVFRLNDRGVFAELAVPAL